MTRLNWSRGLRRLAIVVSALYFALALYASGREMFVGPVKEYPVWSIALTTGETVYVHAPTLDRAKAIFEEYATAPWRAYDDTWPAVLPTLYAERGSPDYPSRLWNTVTVFGWYLIFYGAVAAIILVLRWVARGFKSAEGPAA